MGGGYTPPMMQSSRSAAPAASSASSGKEDVAEGHAGDLQLTQLRHSASVDMPTADT